MRYCYQISYLFRNGNIKCRLHASTKPWLVSPIWEFFFSHSCFCEMYYEGLEMAQKEIENKPGKLPKACPFLAYHVTSQVYFVN